jgi:hypothetical protein
LGLYFTNPYQLSGPNDLGGIVRGKYFDDAIRVIAERAKVVAANTVPYAELVKLDAARIHHSLRASRNPAQIGLGRGFRVGATLCDTRVASHGERS